MAKKTVAVKKRKVHVGVVGQAHIHSSFNNIIVSIANEDGQVISWSSAGKWDLEDLRKILLMQHKWQHKTAEKLHLIWAFAKLKHT